MKNTKKAGCVKRIVTWIWNNIFAASIEGVYMWCLCQLQHPKALIFTSILIAIIFLLDGALAFKYVLICSIGVELIVFIGKIFFPYLFNEESTKSIF
jgi:hypothetical protein